MKRVLFLPGYACQSWIWEKVKNDLDSVCQWDIN